VPWLKQEVPILRGNQAKAWACRAEGFCLCYSTNYRVPVVYKVCVSVCLGLCFVPGAIVPNTRV
jgi:hypothetical protein